MTTIKIALEWFLNPDHLPMIAGVVKKTYEQRGLKVEIIEPKEHYDGFDDLSKGNIDIHCNEPLHLFEHYFKELKSLGCFFETRGGVMIRADRVEKLKSNQKIKITTPASNDITNKIGFEILNRYAKKEGFSIDRENVEFIQTDFWHINNMKNDDSFDGAWLCFYNFEGIEAEYENFENLFIDQFKSPYPNFSALEFMTTQGIIDEKKDALKLFIEVTNEMSKYLVEHVSEAKKIYYDYTKEDQSELMDRIISDTVTRFNTHTKADGEKWHDLYKFLEELDIVTLSDEEYNDIWDFAK
jgi:ABC-type nitrate/sulfonate/bicarbonate transport system substrate-binding protein